MNVHDADEIKKEFQLERVIFLAMRFLPLS